MVQQAKQDTTTAVEPKEEMGLATIERAVLPERMLKELGIPQRVAFRERPGVSPTWMPETVGSTIAGIVRDQKHGVGKFSSSLIVLQTRDGFKTVWLGADLKRKLDTIERGALVIIEYIGKQKLPNVSNEMRMFRVYEVMSA